MEDPFLGDPFLDDLDLFYEGLLSEDDARLMYQRGEITHQQLMRYLEKKRSSGQQQAQTNIFPWFIALAGLIIFSFCLIAVINNL